MNALDRAAAEYRENGFAIIRDVLPSNLLEEARSHVDWLAAKYPDLPPEHLHHPLVRNDAFWVRLISEPRLVDIADFFLGPDLACFTAHYICKPPHTGQPVLWHQDGAYWKLDPMNALTVWLAIDESTTENGCLRMIPGTQHLPLHKPSMRTEQPNMLFSSADPALVDEWAARRGIVDIELKPGDVSIHHPSLLHCSEANTSATRRCGLDIGYIPTTTHINSDGLYLDPILVRGRAHSGINNYRSRPHYSPEETIPFRGHEEWDGQQPGGAGDTTGGESPIVATHRMIERLKAGTVAR